MRTRKTGVVSSIPPCATFKTPLVRKATERHLMNSTSLEENSEPCLWFLLLSKSSMQRLLLIRDRQKIITYLGHNGDYSDQRISLDKVKLMLCCLIAHVLGAQ